ncbi:MAG: pseudouridine synthase [Candidatus Paceibacterota bacterium]|jgi:23S rRNA pseudouridine2604 synthase
MENKTAESYPMRINKYLALKKISTRRGADLLVKDKKVFINKKLAVLGSQVNETDVVEVKGAKPVEYKYFAYNKPIGTETDSPKKDLFPLGRLDKNSHGLLILTNDGRITDQLLNPKYFHEKEYVVRTKEKLRSNFKQKMEEGVDIEGYKTKPCKIKIMSENTFKVILTEGKKHQIRRMCANLFQEVADLKRERIMNIKLGNLKPKAIREIKGEELTIFLNQVLHQS